MREMHKNEFLSSKQAKSHTYVCVSVSVCVFLYSIKVSEASYFSSVAGDVRTSSALLPELAPGEFITSPLTVTV